MFLLFGLRTRDDLVSRGPMVCDVCGLNAVQTVLRRSTKFTLFFIPLFPVKPSTYVMQCGHCGRIRRTDRRAVDHVGVWG